MKFVTWMILWVGVLSPVAQNANAQTTINLWDLDGSNGFILTGLDGGDRSATAIASGDINDDGIDDLIIGAQRANLGVTPRVGETYVVFGPRKGLTRDLTCRR